MSKMKKLSLKDVKNSIKYMSTKTVPADKNGDLTYKITQYGWCLQDTKRGFIIVPLKNPKEIKNV